MAASFTMKMEPARSSENFVSYSNTTWHYNAENLNMNLPAQKSHGGEI
jgi:hypothetical protein